ncbi:ATP-binding cassette domain-containing protein [Psychrobacter sp. HD31]|uniref:ABC transporter ATP-binding protein n=1 Tax=Psychrobacter sp. HD31 TaxID=3112003 RepID=UPI003DA41129
MNAQTKPILTFNNLYYQGVLTDGQPIQLLKHCSGNIFNGDMVLLTGRSGSGKTILLRMLAGLLAAESGNILFNNKSYKTYTAQFWRSQIAMVSQQPKMINGSVLDNLKLPFEFIENKQKNFDTNWHQQSLAFFDKTENFLYQSAKKLSGGEQQIVNLLRVLQLNPTILLLDEPTAALDTTTSQKFIQFIQNWQQNQPTCAVVWITHNQDHIASIHNTLHWIMKDGVLETLGANP